MTDRGIAEARFERILAASEKDLRPGLTAGSAFALGLSVLILAIPPVVAAFGVWLILWSGFAIIATVIGLVVLVMAWGMLPPVNDLGTEPVGRNEAPALFALVDAVSIGMGAPRIDRLLIFPGYNAFVGHFGRRRHRVLGIGLALWQVLDRQERIALLAHELAHEINGDPARSLVISGAQHTLEAWIEMLAPDWRSDGFEGISDYSGQSLARQFMALGAWLLRRTLAGHRRLHMRTSQRAECYADLLAARTAGTAAVRRSHEKLVLRPYASSLLVRRPGATTGAGHALLAGLGDAVAAIPAQECARLFARMEEEQISADASHPPTVYRLRFLERHAGLTGSFDAEAVDWDAIATEIGPFLEPCGQALLGDPTLL